MTTARARFAAVTAKREYLSRPFTSVQLLLLSGGLLLGFGVMMATSTTISASLHDGSHGDLLSQLLREGLFVALGLPVLWCAARLTPRGYRRLAYPIMLVALVLLLAVLVPGLGAEINGARRWLDLGPLQIQPSEFAKLAVLVWGADLLARKEERRTLTQARHVLVPLVPLFVLVFALVMTEPDLGTTLCFMTILLGLLWTVGLPYRYFLGILAAVAAAVTLLAVAEPYRLERLISFTDPFKDANNTGHQAVQGLYALSSGGIFGVGLGSGTSKFGWVPNANTDYVFSVIGEELGLVGCIVVLCAFGLFAYTALRIARRSEDPFVRLAASGTAVWICGQALINIGYVTGLLPVTGIPLPFVSAGGTSLVLTMGVLGMLLSFARHEPAAVAASRASAASRSRWVRALRLGVPRVGGTGPRRRGATRTAAARPAAARPAAPRAPVRAPVRAAAPRSAPAARVTRQPAKPRSPRPKRPAAAPPLRPTGTDWR